MAHREREVLPAGGKRRGMLTMEKIIGIIILSLLGFCMAVVLPICIYEGENEYSLYNRHKRYMRGQESNSIYDAFPITFEQFKTYYAINPDAYWDRDFFDSWRHESLGRVRYREVRDNGSWADHYLTFETFRDFVKYENFLFEWKGRLDNERLAKEKAKANESAARYYQAVIKDIERLKEQAEAEAQQAADIVASVTGK